MVHFKDKKRYGSYDDIVIEWQLQNMEQMKINNNWRKMKYM